MDLNRVRKLSDEQLIELYRNPNIDNEIKESLLKEIKLRELKNLKSEISQKEVEFTEYEKLKLIFLPFLYRYHQKIMFKKSWSRKRDKQFWNYITTGIILYTFLLLIGLLFRNHP
ncbi:hypothetical protein Q4Q34_13840 [Flavivirga abyssicola]|uniref:hypothetical protein n=1 Tax=Flavivirga abyssicola TaxID=3063533 RepID=UPI0026DF4266|nr:hypothetical protein [Flavivirga sp. MEBiC07777]WVK12302.1 hypothetical protein Q4Q34_13840 [Flavivirga sp. MEBiC07777]